MFKDMANNKTILEMQMIFNIANMRERITGIKTNLDNLKQYDLYYMNENELRDIQNNLIQYYNKAVNK